MKQWLYYLPAIVWYGLIFWLSSQPKLPGPGDPFLEVIWFKTAHAVFYAVLTLLWLLAAWIQSPQRRKQSKVFFGVFMIVATLAVLDEFHQGFVPGRTMSSRDVLVDLTASGGVLLALSRYNRQRKR